jgi:hypothetical protein
VDTGLRKENASKQKFRASVLIPSKPISRACPDAVDEAVVPDLIVPPGILAVTIPRRRVFLVVFDDANGQVGHGPNVGRPARRCNGSAAIARQYAFGSIAHIPWS